MGQVLHVAIIYYNQQLQQLRPTQRDKRKRIKQNRPKNKKKTHTHTKTETTVRGRLIFINETWQTIQTFQMVSACWFAEISTYKHTLIQIKILTQLYTHTKTK